MSDGPVSSERRVLIPPVLPPDALSGRGTGFPLFKLEGTTMGTFWSVRGLLPPELTEARARQSLEEVFALVIRQMSHWNPDSDLCAFNRAPAGTWQELPAEFYHVLQRALEIARLSGGCLDPTVGEVVDLYGFGPAPVPAGTLPAAGILDEARGRGGWQRLELDPARQAARQPGGLQLDLSSIAKGFAVDLAARTLTSLGLPSHLVEIGGEVRGTGCKNDGSPWWCRLEVPDDPSPAAPGFTSFTDFRVSGPAGKLTETMAALCGLSAATSADTLRGRTGADGRRFSHLMDPRTARPAGTELASVSVLAPECMDADAWATALFIAGPSQAEKMAEQKALAALFTWRDAGGLRQTWSPALAVMME